MRNSYSVGGRVRYLRERDTQVAGLLEIGVGVEPLARVDADAAHVAHFVEDSTHLRREEQ